ncbi:MAG: hypothetical protein FJ290_05205 [Planctomycetes bacterium]|nr:hypothetical protein [Planctomycetota bacterium]
MLKALCAVVAVVMAGFGAYFAGGHGESKMGIFWWDTHLEVIQGQLAGLRVHLQDFRQAHGRYPTNDEGLAALDNFVSRGKCELPSRWGEPRLPDLSDDLFTWRNAKLAVQLHREHYGRPPATAQEFREFFRHQFGVKMPEDNAAQTVEIELAIGKDDSLFILSPAGVLSPWLVPYVYENRNGLAPTLFADSPANADRGERYSLRVDEGIYVHSVGGLLCAQVRDRHWWEYHGPQFVGYALLAAALALVVTLVWRSKRVPKATVFTVAVSATIGSLAGGFYAMCYAMRSLFSRRSPELISQQRDLLAKYHSRCVINEASYQKAMTAIDILSPREGPLNRPTSEPD